MSFKTRKVLRALPRHGFVVLRISVPPHTEIKRGTVRGIAEDANVPWDKFRREVS